MRGLSNLKGHACKRGFSFNTIMCQMGMPFDIPTDLLEENHTKTKMQSTKCRSTAKLIRESSNTTNKIIKSNQRNKLRIATNFATQADYAVSVRRRLHRKTQCFTVKNQQAELKKAMYTTHCRIFPQLSSLLEDAKLSHNKSSDSNFEMQQKVFRLRLDSFHFTKLDAMHLWKTLISRKHKHYIAN